jgi:hypothetical protein
MRKSFSERWDKLPAFVRWLILAGCLGLIGVCAKRFAVADVKAQTNVTKLVYQLNDTLYFNGPIDERSVTEALRLIDKTQNISRLSINSGGGWPKPSKKLADKIIERSLSIDVRDNCLSACLLFIFPAGNVRSVTDGTILGFHFAPAYDYLVLKDKVPASELLRAKEIHDLYLETLGASKIPKETLVEQGQMLDPLCWRYQTNNLNEKEAVVVYRYNLWFPSKEYFQTRNVLFEGALLIDNSSSDANTRKALARPNHLGSLDNTRTTRLGNYVATNTSNEAQILSMCQ